MSRVSDISNKTGTSASLWMQYIERKKRLKRNGLDVDFYCFYEGIDDCKYYNVKLKEMGKKITHFQCKGKFNLLKFREFMIKKKLTQEILYFIDKDYDDKIKNEEYKMLSSKKNLYITPCYSIENFFTVDEVFSEIVINEYGYSIDSARYSELLEKFQITKNEFHKYIKDINVWYASYKYFFDDNEIIDEISMNNYSLNKYILIDVENDTVVVKKDLLEALQLSLSHTPISFNNKFIELGRSFTNPCCEFRGKMEIFFLNKFIENLNMTKQYKKFNLQQNNIVSNLVQYSKKPMCLDLFIDEVS